MVKNLAVRFSHVWQSFNGTTFCLIYAKIFHWTILFFFSCLLQNVEPTCRFPEFLQRNAPWAASYGPGARLIMYVTGPYMTVGLQAEQRDTKYTRKCDRRVPDNKFLVTHQEAFNRPQYLCIQFMQRSKNIVQMKVSSLSSRQSMELCDERMMAVDRWPIVRMSQTPEQRIECPFIGGFNVIIHHPNSTTVCAGNTLLMRMESECEPGEGIMFDFRQEKCVPVALSRSSKQQAFCIAHWSQGSQTFVILQHSEIHKQMWCLAISDPLHDIRSAHLMLDLVCDTGDVIRDTPNYLRLDMVNRVYASTCDDEVERHICQNMKHLCAQTYFKKYCQRTCGICRLENELSDCAFEETYRGLWIDSSKLDGDKQIRVGPYSMAIERLGQYDCLLLENSNTYKDRRVLVKIDENGCYPRYACAEMNKISTSVMKFRLGNRQLWPLPHSHDQKGVVCSEANFMLPIRPDDSRLYPSRQPILIIKESTVNTVRCGLPYSLDDGIVFIAEGEGCSGCLLHNPINYGNDRFTFRLLNCSTRDQRFLGDGGVRQHVVTVEYKCLASFTFRNQTQAVVTKTTTYGVWGQYLCWIFTTDRRIMVLKASDTFLFDNREILSTNLMIAHFTIAMTNREAHNNRLCFDYEPTLDNIKPPIQPGELATSMKLASEGYVDHHSTTEALRPLNGVGEQLSVITNAITGKRLPNIKSQLPNKTSSPKVGEMLKTKDVVEKMNLIKASPKLTLGLLTVCIFCTEVIWKHYHIQIVV